MSIFMSFKSMHCYIPDVLPIWFRACCGTCQVADHDDPPFFSSKPMSVPKKSWVGLVR